MVETICKYLINTYKPHAIIVYGSFANHTNDENSDFDVMLITDKVNTRHDSNYIEGIKLDAHIFSTAEVEQPNDLNKFVQVFDGKIVIDEREIAKKLKEQVLVYIEENSKTTNAEKEHLIQWCLKMLKRTECDDTEGMYRWHWLLYDSLEIYCNIRDMFYFGPNKTLRWVKVNDLEGYNLVDKALKNLDYLLLEEWMHWVIKQ